MNNKDIWNPIELFKSGEIEELLNGHYWNYSKKSYKHGQITVGFIRLEQADLWLLFHVGVITKDLNILNGIGYEYETLPEYEKYLGRLIIRFKNKATNLIRNAKSVIDDCEVLHILPNTFENDIFPGYDKVDLSWNELSSATRKEVWITALQNQKGVYLITDSSNGKMYVGSAYGDRMLLGRWKSYAKTGHAGNSELRDLSFEHIKEHFRFSILEIFKSTTDDKTILGREQWWKRILLTREFGYNRN